MFIYSALTEWRFLKHRFLMIKWVLVLVVFGVAWFIFGSAISGMASIRVLHNAPHIQSFKKKETECPNWTLGV